MTKLFINDLSECKILDMQALNRVRGGHSYCGCSPLNIDEILAKYKKYMPGDPMPQEPGIPGDPMPIEPGIGDGSVPYGADPLGGPF